MEAGGRNQDQFLPPVVGRQLVRCVIKLISIRELDLVLGWGGPSRLVDAESAPHSSLCPSLSPSATVLSTLVSSLNEQPVTPQKSFPYEPKACRGVGPLVSAARPIFHPPPQRMSLTHSLFMPISLFISLCLFSVCSLSTARLSIRARARSWLDNDMVVGAKDLAYKRMFTLFGMPGKVDTPEMWESIGRYGLGKKRTLEQYQQFIGVNLTTLEVRV